SAGGTRRGARRRRSTAGLTLRAMSIVERVLAEVEAMTAELVARTSELVRIPSISGSDAENDGQAHLARLFDGSGLDVDHWPIDLDALTADPGFPGMEVDRREAWGLVARLRGTGHGDG